MDEHEVRGRVIARVTVDGMQLARAGRDAPAAAGAAPALLATIWDIRDKAESPFITQLVPTPRNFVYEG